MHRLRGIMIPLLIIVLPIILMALATLGDKTDSTEHKKFFQEMVVQLKNINRP